MNIKDIARLADVSVSTVSKILNNKADSISEETKKKVLQIAREYNYTPYSGVIKRAAGQRNFLLSLTGNLKCQSPALLQSVEEAARKLGYSILLQNSGQDQQRERKNLEIASDSCDGILCLGMPEAENAKLLERSLTPFVLVKADTGGNAAAGLTYDWNEAVTSALDHLTQLGHRKIGLLMAGSGGERERLIKRCVKRHYNEIEIPFDSRYAATAGAVESLMQTGVTAVICETEKLAANVYRFAFERDMLIPHEISVIALYEEKPAMFLPELSGVLLPAAELAEAAVTKLVEQIEGVESSKGLDFSYILQAGASTSPPERAGGAAASLLAIGTLNVDVVMKVPMMPTDGETVLISTMASLPGGKGANQAVGAARLGAEVSLIGRIGSDPGGKMLYNALRAAGVNTRGISVDKEVETGKAYINVAENGDSFIQVFAGANNQLKRRHLEHHEALFRTARYCLLQTELPMTTVEWAVDCAGRNGCKVICKPCSVTHLPEGLLGKIHLLVPNEKEAARLSGVEHDVEKQADYFSKAGVTEVIVTLAEKGCYYRGSLGAGYFPAYDEPGARVADTTGAADAFISALAVYLGEGRSMEKAIRFGMVAAGLSVRREGVQPSLPDRDAMELRRQLFT